MPIELPKCLDIFYNHLLSNNFNPAAAELTNEAFHDDWNTRPNPLDPVGGGTLGENWPGSAGVPVVLGLWGTQVSGLKFEPIVHVDSDDGKHCIVSKVSGTMTGEAGPLFPGVDCAVCKDKSFTTLAIDVQVVVDGKIKQTYHLEDWTDAKAQICGARKGPTRIDHPGYDEQGEDLKEVPKCIDIFYDELLSNPLNPNVADLVKESFHDDWNTRANPMDPENGGGDAWPGSNAIPMVLGLWGTQISNLKFERIVCFASGDKVAVVSKMSGTTTGETPDGMPHFLMLPEEELQGKSFTSMAIDVHHIIGGKIKHSYHCEDWEDAAAQVKDGRGPSMLVHPPI